MNGFTQARQLQRIKPQFSQSGLGVNFFGPQTQQVRNDRSQNGQGIRSRGRSSLGSRRHRIGGQGPSCLNGCCGGGWGAALAAALKKRLEFFRLPRGDRHLGMGLADGPMDQFQALGGG